MKNIIRKIVHLSGYSFIKINKSIDNTSTEQRKLFPDIIEVEFWEIYDLCKPFTMTSVERMYALYCSVNYILLNNIRGAFVECGVWRGGSAMLIAKMLFNRNISDRKIYLYDTFEGMSIPTTMDKNVHGKDASILLKENEHIKETAGIWCWADLVDVRNNMTLTNFSLDNTIYIKGKVEDTIPETMPNEPIALLRLDTDWYESTKHELSYLYPNLVINGILIIDDYGHWEGCRKAVDEYFTEKKFTLFNRIDCTGRLLVKTFDL